MLVLWDMTSYRLQWIILLAALKVNRATYF